MVQLQKQQPMVQLQKQQPIIQVKAIRLLFRSIPGELSFLNRMLLTLAQLKILLLLHQILELTECYFAQINPMIP